MPEGWKVVILVKYLDVFGKFLDAPDEEFQTVAHLVDTDTSLLTLSLHLSVYFPTFKQNPHFLIH